MLLSCRFDFFRGCPCSFFFESSGHDDQHTVTTKLRTLNSEEDFGNPSPQNKGPMTIIVLSWVMIIELALPPPSYSKDLMAGPRILRKNLGHPSPLRHESTERQRDSAVPQTLAFECCSECLRTQKSKGPDKRSYCPLMQGLYRVAVGLGG